MIIFRIAMPLLMIITILIAAFQGYRVQKGYIVDSKKKKKVLIGTHIMTFSVLVLNSIFEIFSTTSQTLGAYAMFSLGAYMLIIGIYTWYELLSTVKLSLMIFLCFSAIFFAPSYNAKIFSNFDVGNSPMVMTYDQQEIEIENAKRCIKYETKDSTSKLTDKPTAVVFCYDSTDPEYGYYYFYSTRKDKVEKIDMKDITVEYIASGNPVYKSKLDKYKYNLSENGFFYFYVDKRSRTIYVEESKLTKIDLANT